MAAKTWTLVDHDQDIYVEQFAVGPEDVGGKKTGYSVAKRTLQAGLSQGVDVIEVRNGDFHFVVSPTRGMGVWRASLGSLQLGWNSPIRGPVHPAFVRLAHPDGLGWLDGFDELLVRCGLESNGAAEFHPDGRLRYGLHGKIANIPAHKVELSIDGDSGKIALTGVVDESRMFGSKLRLESTIETHVGRPGLTVRDTVTNLSAEACDFELLYHANFGPPLLAPGAMVRLPLARLAPRDAATAADVPSWNVYGPETPGAKEVCFFIQLAADATGRTQVLLKNAAGQQGVSLKFNTRKLPCFIIWKNFQAARDGYVTGLEPATNFPNAKSFEQRMGRTVALAPGQSRSMELELEPHGDAAGVRAAEAAVAKLQDGVVPQILTAPDPAWAPSA